MRPWAIGVAVLFAWWAGHHAYRLAPVEIEGHAWNIGGAISKLALLAVIAWQWRSPFVHIPASWLASEEVQAIGCTVAYIVKPWAMNPGDEKCSSALGFPLYAVCLVALLWTGAWLLDASREKRS